AGQPEGAPVRGEPQATLRYCASRNVPAKPIGKLIVATTAAQLPQLEALWKRGLANGVEDLVWLTRAEAAEREPEVECVAALYSPSTGIIDSHALLLALQGDAEAAGAQIAFQTRVTSVGSIAGKFEVRTWDPDGEALDG